MLAPLKAAAGRKAFELEAAALKRPSGTESPAQPALILPSSAREPQEDRIVKIAENPKFLESVKYLRNALTGAGTTNMLMALALGGALHPVGIGIGIALGIGIRYLEKKGCFKKLGAFISKALGKAGDACRLKPKVTARGKRLTGNILDWTGDATFLAESASAICKPVSHFAAALNSFFYPINALAKVIDLPIDVKNFEDIVNNKDPNIKPETRRQDLHAEFWHMAFGFLETAGAFIPPVSAFTIGLNVTLQALGFAANRYRDMRDFHRKWLQGYDETRKDSN